MLRSASPSLSDSECETVASGIPGFIDDLRGALGALPRYDDGQDTTTATDRFIYFLILKTKLNPSDGFGVLRVRV